MFTWIDLDRVLQPAQSPAQDSWAASPYLLRGSGFGWADVLPGSCVVLLGEAGSGKTSELRGQVRRMRGEGKTAFFLRLEMLAAGGVQSAVAAEDDRETFARWAEGSERAWLFLDAVDEVRLNRRSLDEAIANLRIALGAALSRCHVVISCRHSDWREEDTARLIEFARGLAPRLAPEASAEPLPPRRSRRARFDGRRPSPEPFPAVRLVRLAPLDRDQIRKYISEVERLPDVDAFMVGLGVNDLWGFTGRPLDVQWLASSWRRRGKFAALRTMIEDNIREKLDDSGRDPLRFPKPISVFEARAAVERLALVATMTGVDAIGLSGHSGGRLDTLRVQDVLPEWTSDTILSLLRLPIFDPETYGCVRIHHRSVREYLAATCLRELRRSGMTDLALQRLLFAQIDGTEMAQPRFAPVIAWLAIDDPFVRRKALHAAPEHLLDLGDPAALPLETRAAALRAYAARFGGRQRTLHRFTPAGLTRFANEDLAAEIRALLAPGNLVELRDALLEMIGRKKLSALADAALAVAREDGIPVFLTTSAIEAVARAGTRDQKRALVLSMLPRCVAERDIGRTLIEALYPEAMDTDELVKIITSVPQRGFVDGYHGLLSSIPNSCPAEERGVLLRKLVELSEQGAARRRAHEWAVMIPTLLDRILEDGSAFPVPLSACAGVLHQAMQSDPYHRIEIEHLLEDHPRVRRAIFWDTVARHRERTGGWPDGRSDIDLRHPLYPNTDDVEWLEVDALAQEQPEARLVAFDALMSALKVWHPDGAEFQRARQLAERRPELLERFLRRMAPREWTPQDMAAFEAMARTEAEISAHEEERRAQIRRRMMDLRLHEAESLDVLELVISEGRTTDHDGAWSVEAVAARYGQDVVDAAIEAVRRLWRDYDHVPPFRAETREAVLRAYLGALGLDLAVRGGLDVSTLDAANVRKAVTLATWRVDRLPPWLDGIAQRTPEVIGDVFLPLLEREWHAAESQRVFEGLARATEHIRWAVRSVVVRLLQKSDPQCDAVLAQLFATFPAIVVEEAVLRELAAARAAASLGAPRRFGLWWRSWFSFNPTEAVAFLVHDVARRQPGAVADAALIACLSVPHAEEVLAPIAHDPKTLLDLLDVVLRHIRPAEDDEPHREAGRFRWQIVESLVKTGTIEAVRGLKRLAEELHVTDWWRDLLRNSADECAARLATKPWMPERAAELIRTHTSTPTSLAELFDVLHGVLEDIRHDIQQGDTSPRATYCRDELDERHYQILLAREIERRAHNRYVVLREPELSDRTRPDLRVTRPGIGVVSVEVKIADAWSCTALESAIERQLVDKYMKDASARGGLLVLISSRKRQRWRGRSRSLANFDALVRHLTNIAARLQACRADIEHLAVLGIDFHEPGKPASCDPSPHPP